MKSLLNPYLIRLFTVFMLLANLASTAYGELRGHKWEANIRSVISREASRSVYVKDVYQKINPTSLAIQFNTTKTDGYESMPVMHFDSSGSLFYCYWNYMGKDGKNALGKVTKEFDRKYSRYTPPASVLKRVQIKTNLCWKSMDSIIFINTLNGELLSVNYYYRQ